MELGKENIKNNGARMCMCLRAYSDYVRCIDQQNRNKNYTVTKAIIKTVSICIGYCIALHATQKNSEYLLLIGNVLSIRIMMIHISRFV